MSIDTGDLRVDYKLGELLESEAATNPFVQFEQWFATAQKADVLEPNAMIMSTVQENGRPAARVVLLKEVTSEGFIFYTNYNSRKSQELDKNPVTALVFNWLGLQRQVRIEGTVEKISVEKSTAYFQSRPKASQIGAWASPQSQIVEDRDTLEQNKAELEAKFANEDVLPCPENWGGFIVKPDLIEFWQGRRSRLHDRLQYKLVDGSWKRERLAP